MKSAENVAFWGVLFLSRCRHHAPVIRHFLRIPAEYAGWLSSIQRGQWLKQHRRCCPGGGRGALGGAVEHGRVGGGSLVEGETEILQVALHIGDLKELKCNRLSNPPNAGRVFRAGVGGIGG